MYVSKLYYSGWPWYSNTKQINHIINIVYAMSLELMHSLKPDCHLGKQVIQLICEHWTSETWQCAITIVSLMGTSVVALIVLIHITIGCYGSVKICHSWYNRFYLIHDSQTRWLNNLGKVKEMEGVIQTTQILREISCQ